MNTLRLTLSRILIVAALLLAAACNRMDRTAASAEYAAPCPEALTASQSRVRELSARVQYLETALRDASTGGAQAAVPGGALWD